ncbi:TIM barrel protein [Pyxidicoccus fallax]|uniref:TIM barrel protein n=1 Tax=Pyxidicoccus fallax TaxID=394095 RepID=A0A848LNF2_9BACT|nr:sugar phosphate isomerase/epimerase family protein [Pyxidicoccus fallax]NMO19209.1 TIM barrel protein [Pyxidicoccus fallax]NPC79892.1 TIM barrel protein [Pyxidicoccus fallax]
MKQLTGPALNLAPFVSDQVPFNTLDTLCDWAVANGYQGVELPSWDARLFDLQRAADDDAYCADLQALLAGKQLVLTSLSSWVQGQALCAHPAYAPLLEPWLPASVRGDTAAREAWAASQLALAARASKRLGLRHHVTASGGRVWPFLDLDARLCPEGLVDLGFEELARRWRPVLDAFNAAGVDLCFQLEQGQDVHDGATFERLRESVGHHPRCRLVFDPGRLLLQQIDYLQFLDLYAPYVGAFHVSDAEFLASGRDGMHGGALPASRRSARPRSPGDGQVDFRAVFARLPACGFGGWAVVDWACALKNPLMGAREAADFVQGGLLPPAGGYSPPGPAADEALYRRALGL